MGVACKEEKREKFGRGNGKRSMNIRGEVNRTGYEKSTTSVRCIYIIFNICIFIYTYIIHG